MLELDLQDKYVMHFLCERIDGLQYREAKANTVSPKFFIVEDLRQFLANTHANKANYRKLLRKFDSEKQLMKAFIAFLDKKILSSKNMALFLNSNKSVTFEGIKLHLFYPSEIEVYGDKAFEENIFSVVQELPYTFRHEDNTLFSFRPDLTFFVNGIYLGYSELKSNYSNQNARSNGRKKVASNYQRAVEAYLKIAAQNDSNESIRKDFLRVFEKAIHITSTDIHETYIIRNISLLLEEIKAAVKKGDYDFDDYQRRFFKTFKAYPLRNKEGTKTERFEEVFTALYHKKMIEKEILYYNFIERELIKKDGSRTKSYQHNDGRLIAPRPKQKFGADKIVAKIGEFLAHEHEPNYFLNQLEENLQARGFGKKRIQELIARRQKYLNNKHVYSLLLQYAAGFGKSNIIGWTALQLKDLRKNGKYIYDKILLVVDRLQLRDQLDTKMHNMNIQKGMFMEAYDKNSFVKAMKSDKRVIVVNLQKFMTVQSVLDEKTVAKLAQLRVAFLIDEIHRSNSKAQHEEMISVFDELQSSFDNNETYKNQQTKKNLIVGFTATPSDHTLARFGEFNKYAESEKIWIPFDSYTMKEAIEDGYILNPIRGIVPVAAKMYFEIPEDELEGFEGDTGYEAVPDNTNTDIGKSGKKYAIRKGKIYANTDRIEAIAKFIVERLVKTVYFNIRRKAKAMLAVSSVPSAIKYKGFIEKHFKEITQQKKYREFKDAPIYIVYSNSQDYRSSSSLNDGLKEKTVLQNFKLAKNGIIIVVDKLQTGFDEPKLHTLFLDKEIRGINAIQTISRVNRKTKYKNDCKIIDFSYKNVNVTNIKKAFEHFSNVVVSDFDPLGDEKQLDFVYKDLRSHQLFKNLFDDFVQYYLTEGEKDVNVIIQLENSLVSFIEKSKTAAKKLKKKVNQYFRILNLLEFVIELDEKYSEKHFVSFWRKYNIEYNQIVRPSDIIDDVEIYFDNKLGITDSVELKAKEETKSIKSPHLKEGDSSNQYRYNISRVIEKRNQEEEAIAELIAIFEDKVTAFFDFLKTDRIGKRLVAKIKDNGAAFSQDEIYNDFNKLYRRYIIKNKHLGKFFIKETKDMLTQLCDDFERTLVKRYRMASDFEEGLSMAAEPEE